MISSEVLQPPPQFGAGIGSFVPVIFGNFFQYIELTRVEVETPDQPRMHAIIRTTERDIVLLLYITRYLYAESKTPKFQGRTSLRRHTSTWPSKLHCEFATDTKDASS